MLSTVIFCDILSFVTTLSLCISGMNELVSSILQITNHCGEQENYT